MKKKKKNDKIKVAIKLLGKTNKVLNTLIYLKGIEVYFKGYSYNKKGKLFTKKGRIKNVWQRIK